MKRRIFCGIMILCFTGALLTSCRPKEQETSSGESGDVIHTINQLNKAEPVLNDHADDWDKSSLEPNFRQYTEVTGDRCVSGRPTIPGSRRSRMTVTFSFIRMPGSLRISIMRSAAISKIGDWDSLFLHPAASP